MTTRATTPCLNRRFTNRWRNGASALLAAAALALLAAGCSSGSSGHAATSGSGSTASAKASTGTGGVQQVTIATTNSFRFDPATVTAHVGMVRVTLTNSGSYPHNLSIDALHFTSKTVSGNPGENSTTFTMNFTHAGTYNFVCTFHSSAGMKGQFVITQ